MLLELFIFSLCCLSFSVAASVVHLYHDNKKDSDSGHDFYCFIIIVVVVVVVVVVMIIFLKAFEVFLSSPESQQNLPQ